MYIHVLHYCHVCVRLNASAAVLCKVFFHCINPCLNQFFAKVTSLPPSPTVLTTRVVPLKQDPTLEMRLLDDGFTKICDMVNDEAMAVRALAASLLGDFSTVSWKFLEQTLDKKLMSHLKV